MKIIDISTARLKEYENNPRNNDLAVEKIKHSIDRFGFLFPIVIDINYVIVCGHTRVRACRELGLPTVPCIMAEDLNEEQVKFFRLVDNKTSEYSDWDFEKLKEELSLIDLTLEANQLLLDRFELSAEVFDLDPEQAEIKIPAFNFMGVNEQPKTAVPTPASAPLSADAAPEKEEPTVDSSVAPLVTANEAPVTEATESVGADATEQPVAEEPKKPKGVLPFCQFRFGDVAFFISQVELDRLNAKYAEYIDSGAALGGSFVNFLLKGVENPD